MASKKTKKLGWQGCRRRETKTKRSKDLSPQRIPRSVSPDSVDFRDRPVYAAGGTRTRATDTPSAVFAPSDTQPGQHRCLHGLWPLRDPVIHVLLSRRDKKLAAQVAPFMLYGMARHYDNLPGTNAANGSCPAVGRSKPGSSMAPATSTSGPSSAEPKPTGKVDWWDDGVRRPLGAHDFRVEPPAVGRRQCRRRSTTRASFLEEKCHTHPGWDVGSRLTAKEKKNSAIWKILSACRPRAVADTPSRSSATPPTGSSSRFWGEDWGARASPSSPIPTG